MSLQRFFVLLFISLVFFITNTNSQNITSTHQLKLIETGVESSPIKEAIKSNEEVLTDVEGNIVGISKGEIIDSEKKLRLTFQNGKTFLVLPYQFTAISKNLSNIITYGDHFEFDVFNKFFINVYSGDGKPVRTFDSKLFWPYTLGLYDDGNFIAAGSNYNENNTIIRKYANNGSLIWERKIRQAADLKIKVSPGNKFISIILRDRLLNKRILYVFNDMGTKLYEEEHPEDMYNFDFISDNKLIIFSPSNWILYSLGNDVVRKGRGKLRSKPAGLFPVTGINKGEQFAFLLFSESREGYILTIVDSNTGEITTSKNIYKKPTLGFCRSVVIDQSNLLEVYIGDEVMKFLME